MRYRCLIIHSIRTVKTGFKAVDLYFDSIGKANKMLNDDKLRSRIRCEINNRNFVSCGVISDWDGSILRLGEAIEDKGDIISIERMMRRKYNQTDKKFNLVNTNNFIVFFRGRSLPENVSLYNGLVKVKVRVYFPAVKQCFNCYKYGHVKATCGNKAKICVMCGEEYHGQCDRPARCVNCYACHKANDKICERYAYNKQVLKLSALKNVSIYEAKNIIRNNVRQEIAVSNVWSKPKEWPRLMNSNQNREGGIRNRVAATGGGKLPRCCSYDFKGFIEKSYVFLEKVTLNIRKMNKILES